MKNHIPHINGMITAGFLLVFAWQSASSKIYIGGRAGVSRSSIVQQIDLDYRSGWSIGWNAAAMADIPIGGRFSLRPELAIMSQGGSFLTGMEEDEYRWEHKVTAYALQPAFLLAYNFPILDVKMTVYVGPALNFQLDGNLTTRAINDGDDSLPAEQSVRPFDLIGSGGISVEYGGVFFSITTFSGLLDRRRTLTENEGPVLQNNLVFSLGYFFR